MVAVIVFVVVPSWPSLSVIVLILLLLLLGGGGLIAPALHILWILLVIGLILWVLGFFIRGAEGRGRWYGW